MMFGNLVKVTVRFLLRQKWYTILNIVSLALGLTISLLLLAYIRVDLTFDRYHKHGDRVARVVTKQNFGNGRIVDIAVTMGPLGPALMDELPEVVNQTRYFTQNGQLVQYDIQTMYSKVVGYVDPSFFNLFTFTFLEGSPETALTRPDALVLTESARDLYFGSGTESIGKTIRINDEVKTVTAVISDPPMNSHLTFELLASFESLRHIDYIYNSWNSGSLATYLLLAPGINAESLDSKLTEAYHRHGSWDGLQLYAQPLHDIHLHSAGISGLNWNNSDVGTVRTLFAFAVLILLVASINFINLATARSIRRSREVGLRKVVGASKSMLLLQFLAESLLTALLAMILASAAVELLLPLFQQMTGRALPLNVLDGGFATITMLSLTVFLGLLSGAYPAFVLSGYRPAAVLKGSGDSSGRGGVRLRQGLVVAQFAISVALIVATFTMYKQAAFIRDKNLGYDKESVLVIPLRGEETRQQADALEMQLQSLPDVLNSSQSTRLPTRGGRSMSVLCEGETERRLVNCILTDDGLDDVLQLNVADGRFFDPDYPSDEVKLDDRNRVKTGTVVINEAAARDVGWTNPINKVIQIWGFDFKVVGVVKDFHYQSLRSRIKPLVFVNRTADPDYLLVRYDTDDIHGLIASIEKKWSSVLPERPFERFFLDDDYNRYFTDQQKQAKMVQVFALIAIGIALLGLIGLVSYSTERRQREIGIRKVLGASERSILALIGWEFTLQVLLANLIAWPAAWLLVRKWLEQFAFRTQISWWIFPSSGLFVLSFAALTVCSLAFRAARLNPADVLQDE
jgi:putative ABC transport system permease protein